jgi:putative thioredoxin
VSAHSFDSTTADFERDVLEASKRTPVVVDFWAPWCGPCRALKPILEKLAAEFDGKFLLAKVNTDENPEIAARYGVRGIPNVKAFRNGQVVDEFTGALPAPAVAEFLDRLTGPPASEQLLEELTASGEFPEILGPLAEHDYERVLEWLLGDLENADLERRERIRQIMVSLFGELGPEDPVATQYRRRLASALY